MKGYIDQHHTKSYDASGTFKLAEQPVRLKKKEAKKASLTGIPPPSTWTGQYTWRTCPAHHRTQTTVQVSPETLNTNTVFMYEQTFCKFSEDNFHTVCSSMSEDDF